MDECPPFSQKNDEASVTVQGTTPKDKVRFRGRYAPT